MPTANWEPEQPPDSVALFFLCAEDTDSAVLWAEFVRRFASKLKHFIRGTLRQALGCDALQDIQESDLFQNCIMRLVENDCAAMKRFSGRTEAELFAYLAVISRSVVRDALRRQRALKRPPAESRDVLATSNVAPGKYEPGVAASSAVERHVLGREIAELSKKALRRLSGRAYSRDLLIFQLYFYDDLSATQIARCRGVELSKAGVEKVLSRLKERVRATAERPEAMTP
jgi:RNA polymerase sigma factor (sigma-70 family)